MSKGAEDDVLLKILHTADWHLGKDFPAFNEGARETLRRARLEVLDRIFLEANRKAVDAVLCAGDLFDDPRPNKHWWEGLATKLSRLQGTGWSRPIFLLPGNHDALLSDSVWLDAKFRSLLPSFVHIIDTDVFEYSFGEHAVLYAVPCRSQAGSNDPTLLIPKRTPGDARIRIGLVHGSTFDATNAQTSFPISKDAVIERDLDYLALGDTHGFRYVPPERKSPPTIYSGAPEPTSFDETDPGHVSVVLITAQRRATVQKQAVANWQWETVTCTDLHQLRALASRTDLKNRVLRLTVAMNLSACDYEEASVLLEQLRGTEAQSGKVGVLQLRRDELTMDTTSLGDQVTQLPDVLQAAIARLQVIANDHSQRSAAQLAIHNLLRMARSKR